MKTIGYTRKINIGNYESFDVVAGFEVEEGETYEQFIARTTKEFRALLVNSQVLRQKK